MGGGGGGGEGGGGREGGGEREGGEYQPRSLYRSASSFSHRAHSVCSECSTTFSDTVTTLPYGTSRIC